MSKRTKKRLKKKPSLKRQLRLIKREWHWQLADGCERSYRRGQADMKKIAQDLIEKAKADRGLSGDSKILRIWVAREPEFAQIARYGEQWVAQVAFSPECVLHATRFIHDAFSVDAELSSIARDIGVQIERQVRKALREHFSKRGVSMW